MFCLIFPLFTFLAACSDDDSGQVSLVGSEAPPGESAPQGPDLPVAVDLAPPGAVLRACVILGSCIPDSGVNACLRDLTSGGDWAPETVACLAESSGCDEVERCTGLRHDPTDGPCFKGKNGSYCQDPSTAYYCFDERTVFVDCASRFPAGCVNGVTPNQGFCGTGRACQGSNGVPIGCEGDTVRTCDNGVELFGEACGLRGLECTGGRCTGQGGACTAGRCEGERALMCIGGRTQVRDCSVFGPTFGCGAVGPRDEPACLQASQCDPNRSEHTESCEGNTLVLCYGGSVVRVDCTELGFSGCGQYGCVP